jgi:hypothetical protein
MADRRVINTTFIDGPRMDIMFECYHITGCHPKDLEYLLRLKLSECPYIPVRTMFMLQDKLIPLRLIDGVVTVEGLKNVLLTYPGQRSKTCNDATLADEWGTNPSSPLIY